MTEVNSFINDGLLVSDEPVVSAQDYKEIKMSTIKISEMPKSPEDAAALIWRQWMLCSMLNEKLQSENSMLG